MILNDNSIKQRNLISDGRDDCYRAASYDLTVGQVVTPQANVVEEYSLEPQGVVKVISKELVNIPANITGYVHVKTSMCNEGILALNIGIVDPGFSGPLQSSLINFGKMPHRIRVGTIFGRITFHEHEAAPRATVTTRSISQVIHDAQTHVDKYLAKDFLDFSKTAKKVAKKVANKYRNTLLIYVPAFVIALATLTYFLNFANMSRLEGYINVNDRAMEISERKSMNAKFDLLTTRNRELQDEVSELRQQVNSRQPVGPLQSQQKNGLPRK